MIPIESNENAKEWGNTGKGWTKGQQVDALRKYKSRKSNRNFDNVEFEYKGNSGRFEDFIKKRPSGSPHSS